MGKLNNSKFKGKKFKVDKIKKYVGGGSKISLITSDKRLKEQLKIDYVESAGVVYFVGITEKRVKLANKTAREVINEKYNII